VASLRWASTLRRGGTVNATGIPTRPQDIDPGWLTEALSERRRGVRVSEVTVLDEHELTNNHAMLGVRYGEQSDLPATMFCKLAPLDPARRDAIIASGMGLREARFYDSLAPLLSLRVPVAYVARYGEDGRFVLLLEDLESSGCRLPDGTWGIAPDAAAVALSELAQFHLRYLDETRRRHELSWLPVGRHNSAYAAPMLRYGIDHHRDELSDHFVELAECYIAQPEVLHELWRRGPHTALHGDPHIGNLFDDHGRIGFLDWGIMNISTPMRDVSYFINLGLSIDDRRNHERDLLGHYLEIWNSQSGARITFDQAWLAHRIQAAYLVTACCQIVTFPPDATERRRVLAGAFLARAEAAIADLDTHTAVLQNLGC